MMACSYPSFSVIINTYNRGHSLKETLLAVGGLIHPSFEVIVVNGPSTDDSESVISTLGDRIKALKCDEVNLSVSRNIGISAASGDIVAFIDDDAIPHPLWLNRLQNAYGDPEVGGVGGFTIDSTGVRWQVRKTVCDRFGNAFDVSSFFDERSLCRPGSPYYPSLLGTNSSFRRHILHDIGGFDSVFAYLLDETDVCLRIIDAGWKLIYEPTALVFHQFAPSHIRAPGRVAKTLLPSATSKSYFIMKHASKDNLLLAGTELDKFKKEILKANDWLQENKGIARGHRYSLDEDLVQGIDRGIKKAFERQGRLNGDLAPATSDSPFKPFERGEFKRIVFVSQGFPPRVEAGIARWTAMAAKALAKRGHHIHVLTQAGQSEETVEFKNGFWTHNLSPDKINASAVSEMYNVPFSISEWCGRVWRELNLLKSFGLDVVSFPIWDLEGLPALDDPTLRTVVSLHTTYAMAKPFKHEWNIRPLFEHHMIDRVIAAEKALLEKAPALLANSQAIITAIRDHYGLEISDRSVIVPHGTEDPLAGREERAYSREQELRSGAPLRVLFVGRFEPRKGFDIALEVASRLMGRNDIEIRFAGDTLEAKDIPNQRYIDINGLKNSPRIKFLGVLERSALDDAFVDSDLLLAPSRFESFGLVAIEAMAARRPVICLASSGLAEVAKPENGGTAVVGVSNVAAQIAGEIIRFNEVRGQLLKMGALARRAFEEHYTVEKMANGLETFYNHIAASKGRRHAN